MSPWCLLCSVLIFCMLQPWQVAIAQDSESWLRDTPLKKSYQLLLDGLPVQAWQALLLQVREHRIEPDFWQPLAAAIIQESQCGRLLEHKRSFSTLANARGIKLIRIQKSNPRQMNYQVKLVLYGRHEKTKVTLTDSYGQTWLEGLLPETTDDVGELESVDYFQPLPSGLYILTLNQEIFSILLLPQSEQQWLTVQNSHSHLLSVQFPKAIANCPTPLLEQQWFSTAYTLLGPTHFPEPLHQGQQRTGAQKDTSSSVSYNIFTAVAPKAAAWSSYFVGRIYYQGRIVIEDQQRLTLPVLR